MTEAVLPVLKDSRRMPGVNLLFDGPGAVIDVACGDADAARLIALWQEELVRTLDAVGWSGAAVRTRRFPGGASLFVAAPVDGLYAATEVNEWAWAAAVARSVGDGPPSLDEAADRLRDLVSREREPSLTAMQAAAERHGVGFHVDHLAVSVGSGAGAVVWEVDDPHHPVAPPPDSVDWGRVRDVPTALVTGSNGKTTTVRLLAAVARAWGKVPGSCSTDYVQVGDEIVDRGDWSGPMGARAVLRDPRVEVAVLETARGGILRRGLAVRRADAAIVTNVAEDHFGEWGISDTRGIAEAKLVVGRVARRLTVNADDPILVEALATARAERRIAAEVDWFTLDAANPLVREHVARGGRAAVLDGGDLVLWDGPVAHIIAAAADVPITLGGAARFNIANALGAILVAAAVGVPHAVIARGLRAFRGTPADNPGRAHLWDFGGTRVLVDFAHNPHGLAALIETAQALPARRRLVVLGQAGDRDDESIRALARVAWPWRPDRVILKEMEQYLRGRRPGEATGLIRDELTALGADLATVTHAASELEAVRSALAEAQPGDLVLLPVHAQREAVLSLMTALEATQWRPGQPLPAERQGG
jgi:UDP-N-acetylmuramyl tripeptide synthase